jgi:lipopolysaccharide transport system permease protein
MIVSLIDFAVSFAIFIILMLWYGVMPDIKICLLPLLLLMAILTSLGAGYIISALNVKYRDFRYVVPFIVQFGLYISPVGFSSSVIPEKWRMLYSLNPMVGVIDGFRWCLLGKDISIFWPGFIISIGFAIFLFLFGIMYFNKTERSFADII